MKIKKVKINSLIAYTGNAKDHPPEQVKKIAASINTFGFNVPLLIDSKNEVIAGHGRLLAAKELGLTEVPCICMEHLSESQIKAFRIADNKVAESGWLDEELRAELATLQEMDFDLALTGFDDDELTRLLSDTAQGLTDEDSVPDVKEEPVTRPGDLWILGSHRLLCGDSTSMDDVEKLMQGDSAGCVITSPPYAMQRKSTYGGIAPQTYPEWFTDIAACVWAVLDDSGSFFVNIKEHVDDGQRSLYVFKTIEKMVNSGWRYVDQLIWTKPGLPGAWNNRLKNDFEPVHFFTKKDSISYMVQEADIDSERLDSINPYLIDCYEDIYHFTKRKKITFKPRAVGTPSDSVLKYHHSNPSYGKSGNISVGGKSKKGIARPGNVLTLQGNTENLKHPAVFPVKLPEFFIKLTTETNNVIYEPFGGAGTSLIACEKTSRKARVMEILPEYCDVIIKRWEEYTGKKAERSHG